MSEFDKWWEQVVDARSITMNQPAEFIMRESAKITFEYQQKKINELEKQLTDHIIVCNRYNREKQELEAQLKEAVEVIKHYDYPDVGIEGKTIIKSGCVAHDFLAKYKEKGGE